MQQETAALAEYSNQTENECIIVISAYCNRLDLARMMVMNCTVVYGIGLKYAFWIVEIVVWGVMP